MGLIEFFFSLSEATAPTGGSGEETEVWNDDDPWDDSEPWPTEITL